MGTSSKSSSSTRGKQKLTLVFPYITTRLNQFTLLYVQCVTVTCKNEKCEWNNAWGFSMVVQEDDIYSKPLN